MSVKGKTSALSLSMLLMACQGHQLPQKSSTEGSGSNAASVRPEPPIAKRVDYAVVSTHGTRNDPYYWLRDDERKAPEVLEYLNAENAYAKSFFAPLQEEVSQLFDEMKARVKEDDASVPYFYRGYWYYTRFETGAQYPIYARRKQSMSETEEVLLDGNAMAKAADTIYFNIGASQVSPDGTKLLYAVDTVGRRQYTLYGKDIATGRDLGFKVESVTANVQWASDSETFFYTDDDEQTLLPYRLYRATIRGFKPELVYEEKDSTFYLSIGATKSEKYLLVNSGSTLTSEIQLLPLAQPSSSLRSFLPRERGHEYSLDHFNSRFYVRSNRLKASNFALYSTEERLPTDAKNWRSELEHRADALLEEFEVFNDFIVVNERSSGLRKLRVLATENGAQANLTRSELLAADDPSYVMYLQSTPDVSSQTLRYSYVSLTTPNTTYDYDLRSKQRTLLKQEPVVGSFQSSDYASQYLQATARDGTKLPISLVYKKTTPLDGSAPLYQYGYGSYGASMEPNFSSMRLSLLDRGFVYAIAHIRGGEEMGRQWYEDGKLLKKINTFTDFIDVTDYLVANKIGAKDKIVAAGGSAGGLLMGAVINLAPQKYRAIAAHVPFVDVVTTMLDESIPLTTGEFDEWGNPKDKPYYDYMLSYSPYDQVKAQSYPRMLVTTGLHDSQVQYFEPAKWVAKLRVTKSDQNPLIFKINMEAGHGGRSGRFNRMQEIAEEYAFFLDAVRL